MRTSRFLNSQRDPLAVLIDFKIDDRQFEQARLNHFDLLSQYSGEDQAPTGSAEQGRKQSNNHWLRQVRTNQISRFRAFVDAADAEIDSIQNAIQARVLFGNLDGVRIN